jgi:hypothetical protein
VTPPPTPQPAETPPPELETDPLLVQLLTEAFVLPGSPLPKVHEDGLVEGPQDPQKALRLLQRHSLLHCVKLGEGYWRWFWGNLVRAKVYAAENGLLLDEEALR